MTHRPVHFHDGPRAGGGQLLGDDINVLPVIVDGVLLGAYLRDPGSAGARCMDWDPDVTYQDIVPAPARTHPPAAVEGPTWHESAQ